MIGSSKASSMKISLSTISINQLRRVSNRRKNRQSKIYLWRILLISFIPSLRFLPIDFLSSLQPQSIGLRSSPMLSSCNNWSASLPMVAFILKSSNRILKKEGNRTCLRKNFYRLSSILCSNILLLMTTVVISRWHWPCCSGRSKF